jgi:hypothetical protein
VHQAPLPAAWPGRPIIAIASKTELIIPNEGEIARRTLGRTFAVGSKTFVAVLDSLGRKLAAVLIEWDNCFMVSYGKTVTVAFLVAVTSPASPR